MAPLALLTSFPTRLSHLHCHIALLALSASIELVSSSARVTSVKSAQSSWGYFQTLGPIDRIPGIPGSDKNIRDGRQEHNRLTALWL